MIEIMINIFNIMRKGNYINRSKEEVSDKLDKIIRLLEKGRPKEYEYATRRLDWTNHQDIGYLVKNFEKNGWELVEEQNNAYETENGTLGSVSRMSCVLKFRKEIKTD